jgi:protein-S-isoprenylcysteine O-methyltransferase Ste14
MIQRNAYIFLICLFLLALFLPLHFLSVNHTKLSKGLKKQRAEKVGKILGIISGWGYFLCLILLWMLPQPHFAIPLLTIKIYTIPLFDIPLYLLNIIFALPFISISVWFGISGVQKTTLEVSEYHKPHEVITEGVYAVIRHPQYLAAILAHIGCSILFSGLYSLISTPLIVAYNVLISWKEEKELMKEFGETYRIYKEKTPMFFPRFRSNED